MNLTPERFEAGFELFRALLTQSSPELQAELLESRGRFLGAKAFPTEETPESLAASRRHLEWFLFEHLRTPSSELLVEELLEPWAALADGDLRESREAYLQSQTGIFAVSRAEEGQLVELRELAGLARFELAEQPLGQVFAVGDLIVGRLFPLGEGLFHVSPGAGVFRDPRIVAAIERDLERLRESRSHAVMRLSQLELEGMFFGGFAPGATVPEPSAPAEGANEESVAELEAFLLGGGVQPSLVAAWFGRMQQSPRDVSTLVPESDQLLTAILEVLAFETELDLDRARMLILAAWPALHAQAEGARAARVEARESSAELDVRTAMAEFDRDRAAGIDVETSFRELERKLGLDDEDGEGDDPAPDFPGVVGAMVEEFLWEARLEHGEQRAAELEGLRLFAKYTHKLGVFENLGTRDFLAFAAFWLPESREVTRAEEAERIVRALEAFGAWAVETHGVDTLEASLASHLADLRQSLPRAIAANALLPAAGETQGELFTFLGALTGGAARVRGLGDEDRTVELGAELCGRLLEGDLFRGYTSDEGEFVVACCYPPEAAELRQLER
jgi:hypothetical protein